MGATLLEELYGAGFFVDGYRAKVLTLSRQDKWENYLAVMGLSIDHKIGLVMCTFCDISRSEEHRGSSQKMRVKTRLIPQLGF